MSSAQGARRHRALQHRPSARKRNGPDRFTILPHELILMIFDANKSQQGHTSTMASLCRVNKTFSAIATEPIYRKFSSVGHNENSNKAITKPYLFVRTILWRPDLAKLVKEVSLEYEAGSGPVANPNPDVISQVFHLVGPRDYSLSIPWGVASLRPTDLRNLFSFSVEQILFKLPMLERFDLKMLGGPFGPDRRWEVLTSDGVRDSLQRLRHVSYEADDTLNVATSQFVQVLGKMAPALLHLSLTACLGDCETLQPFTIRSVQSLDLGSSSFSDEQIKGIIEACESLISFKYMPQEKLYRGVHTESTLPAILEALVRHRGTLVTLSLWWKESRCFLSQDSIYSLKDLRKLENLVSLTTDIALLGKGEMLVDVLPRRLQNLKLIRRDFNNLLAGTGWVGWVANTNAHSSSTKICEHMLNLAVRCSQFPSLRTVTLLSLPALNRNAKELLSNKFGQKEVDFLTIEIDWDTGVEEIERLGG